MNAAVPPSGRGATSLDLSAVPMWRLEPGCLEAPDHAPERAWLRRTAAEYGVPDDVLIEVLHQLSLGWSFHASLQRASVPPDAWGSTVGLVHRLIHAGVIVKAGHRDQLGAVNQERD